MAERAESELKLDPSETTLIDRVHSFFPNNKPNRFFFFYATASPFSNFHPCIITESGIQFHCSEQYMMYYKAKVFNDNDIAEQILLAEKPSHCKQLGREVADFDGDIWKQHRTRIVSDALYLKFTQNEDLKAAMLKHSDKLFVEAAANDCIWGVGLRENNPLIKNPSNWKGLNLLGYILTDVCHRIRNENKAT